MLGELFFGNVLVGVVAGAMIRARWLRALAVLPLCVAALIDATLWQTANPEAMRSTSGLDLPFSFLWPALAGIVGLTAGRLLKMVWARRR